MRRQRRSRFGYRRAIIASTILANASTILAKIERRFETRFPDRIWLSKIFIRLRFVVAI
uniref:Uncharacterized protein n=1 Tax=Romanomermis culicivorax TaxID=13658 RepID=A0A915IRT2_ROMCU